VSVDWQKYTKSNQHKYGNAKKVVLPNYAFDKVTCWFNDKPFRIVGTDARFLFFFFFFWMLDGVNIDSSSGNGIAHKIGRRETPQLEQDYVPVLKPYRFPMCSIFETEIQLLPYLIRTKLNNTFE